MKKDENKEKLGKQEEESPKLNKKKVFSVFTKQRF